MKKNTQKLLVIVMCALSFTACKKDQLTPEQPMAAKPNGDASLLQPAPTYILQRRGYDSLEYYSDGRLAKVIGQFGYTVYNYAGFGTIKTKTFENGLLAGEDTYQVDVASGRVFEHEKIGYTNFPNGSIVTTNVFKFTYDAQGRLFNRYNKNKPNERRIFTYSADGNVTQIKSYNESNQLVFTYNYSYSANVAKNKLKLNVEYHGIDLFLNIFGKVSRDMPQHQSCKSEAQNDLIWSEWLTYTVNNDGYPVNFTRFDFVQNKMKPTVEFRYKPMRAKI